LQSRAKSARARLDAIARLPFFRRPHQRLFDLSRRLDELDARALRAVRISLRRGQERCRATAARLESLSPLAVLGRGYSLTRRVSDGRLIRDAADLSPGEAITTRFIRGQAVSRVERVEP